MQVDTEFVKDKRCTYTLLLMYGFPPKRRRKASRQKKKTGETNIRQDETKVVGPCPAAGDDFLIFPVGCNSFKRRFLRRLCPFFRVPLIIQTL
jgi:hypothetical protein